jgi:general secretion pathway protein F/type IV pilus assembly protein PilC
MPDFAYIARDLTGQKVTGTISAATERDALAQLGSKSLFPIDVSLEDTRAAARSNRRVKGQVMATTYSQLAALLRSGVPLMRSLRVIRDQSSNVTLKYVLDEVCTRVEDGALLGDVMARHPKVFNEMAIHMVRAGTEGGFLEEALERVAKFTEQQEDLKSRTVGALAYPVFLMTVGSLVVSGLIVFVVPRFEGLFARLDQRGELPALTGWLLSFSATLQDWLLILAGIAIVGALFIRAKLQTEEGLRTRDLLKIKLPGAGGIFLSLAVARFCRVLGTLLRNGVPILKSLEISRQATGNRILSEAIAKASENITAGQSLAAPLEASGRFPKTVVEMISVAEESNTLDTVLVEIADSLERRTERRLDLLVRLLEPIMLLILAGVVLFVVIALLLPVIKLSGMV